MRESSFHLKSVVIELKGLAILGDDADYRLRDAFGNPSAYLGSPYKSMQVSQVLGVTFS
jgi:hypothetical protein